MTEQINGPLFISVSEYSRAMGISEGLARKQVKAGDIRHIRAGDRVLIPHDEPQRQFKAAMASLDAG